MTDHDALLRAICDQPDDDTPRLIFADFLDENGQPDRAAFIRTDVLMARRDPFDPERLRWEWIEKPRVTADDSPAAAALPPLPPRCAWPPKLRFRRGFPWAVHCKDQNQLAALAVGAFADSPLTHVTQLWQSPWDRLEWLAAAAWPARLTGLSLHDGNIDRAGVGQFLASPLAAGLRELELHHEPLRADSFRALAASPVFARLTSLVVHTVQQGRVEADAISGAAGALRRFRFAASRPPDMARLLASPALRNLEELALGRVNADGARELAAAPHLKSLASLSLAHTHLGENSLGVILASSNWAGLRSLSLTSTGMRAARAEQLAASPAFANLRELNLSSCLLGNAGATAIATSPHLAGLRVLDLSYTQLGDDGFRAILESPLADGLVYFRAAASPASAEMKQAVSEKFGDRAEL